MSQLFVGASHSAIYAKFRPTPPPVLINKILSYLREKIPGDLEKAADVGCGTGQSTLILQPYFQQITGFDISETQINEAREQIKDMPNITYCISPAETLPVPAESLQLVTVSQAAHWFNIPEFFKEVHRILVPNGVCAIYGYPLPIPTPEDPVKTKDLHDVIWKFYTDPLAPFWDERRHMVDAKYEEIEIPHQYFANTMRCETLATKKITLADYKGLITSWSAFQQMQSQDPDRANKELSRVMESMTNIIDADHPEPSKIPLTLEATYFLLMGRKKE